ncbi:MAG TPA: hypothetical protein VK129_10040 [Terriglobales bacterium]|nr:hypothetical protein [Terriglobales bacterium]
MPEPASLLARAGGRRGVLARRIFIDAGVNNNFLFTGAKLITGIHRLQESIAANPCSEFSKSEKARPHLNAVSRTGFINPRGGEFSKPQGLKPAFLKVFNGMAEALPFQSLFMKPTLVMMTEIPEKWTE